MAVSGQDKRAVWRGYRPASNELYHSRSTLIKTRAKPWGTTAGTSIASKYLRQYLNVNLPIRLPTLTEASLNTLKPSMTKNLGAFVGRGLPVIGWVILASDVSQIVYKTVRDYNIIAHEKDRIW